MLDLIVSIRDIESDASLIHAALALAHRHGAFLTGLQLVASDSPLMEATSPIDDFAERERAALARRDWWLQRCSATGIAGEWEVRQGFQMDALAKRSQLADFVIGKLHISDPDSPAGFDEVTRAMFASSSAMLLVPDTWQRDLLTERMVIAWNGSATAARAVKAALPLLKKASVVHVLDGERPGLAGISMPPLPLRGWLQRHGINAQWEAFQGGQYAGCQLQERAAQLHADVLVLGAWGRSRITELVLGGTTRWLLEHASMPLFLIH